MLKNKFTVTYTGNRRQLTRFVYQLLKRGSVLSEYTSKKPFEDIKFNVRHFSDASVVVFKDGEIMVTNHKPNPASEQHQFDGPNWREALNAISVPFNINNYGFPF